MDKHCVVLGGGWMMVELPSDYAVMHFINGKFMRTIVGQRDAKVIVEN